MSEPNFTTNDGEDVYVDAQGNMQSPNASYAPGPLDDLQSHQWDTAPGSDAYDGPSIGPADENSQAGVEAYQRSQEREENIRDFLGEHEEPHGHEEAYPTEPEYPGEEVVPTGE